MELPSPLLSPSSKNKKIPSKKSFDIFSKKSFSYISGNDTYLFFWKSNFLASCFSYISGGDFLSSKNQIKQSEKILIFREMELIITK